MVTFVHNNELVASLAKIVSKSESEENIASLLAILAAIVNNEQYVNVLASSMYFGVCAYGVDIGVGVVLRFCHYNTNQK